MTDILPLACLGVSHRTAGVALRERLAFTPDGVQDFYRRTAIGTDVLLLSTCNRTELYLGPVDEPEAALDAALDAVSADRRVPAADLARAAYRLHGLPAALHLARVAAGVDSMVFGESEILGQVREAGRLAAEAGVGLFLRALAEHAVRAGRRARAETDLGRRPASVASEAVHAVARIRDLAGARVVLVGAGAMARSAGQLFRSLGSSEIGVVTRTTRHGARLARELGGQAMPWHDLPHAVAHADVILAATTAPHPLITAELVAQVRSGAPVVLVDISVPRNVEPGVRALPGVQLLDLDQIQGAVEANLSARRQALPVVERLIAEEVGHYVHRARGETARPVLAALHAHGEAVRVAELTRLLERLGPLDPQTHDLLAQFSRTLVAKVLHAPSRAIRQSDVA
jgi:glutamyl-tRNA reductase